jgi:hypothetical protein
MDPRPARTKEIHANIPLVVCCQPPNAMDAWPCAAHDHMSVCATAHAICIFALCFGSLNIRENFLRASYAYRSRFLIPRLTLKASLAFWQSNMGFMKPALVCQHVMLQCYLVLHASHMQLPCESLSQNLLNYDGPHVLVIVVMTSDSHTYVPHNLKGLLSSEQDPIIGVLQYYNSLFKIPSE